MNRGLPDTARRSGAALAFGLAGKKLQRACFAFALIAVAMVAAATMVRAAQAAENPDVAKRRAAERTNFSNDEIVDGFFKTAFHAELQFDRRDERIRKFDEPVRVYVVSSGTPDRSAEIANIVADIRAHVANLDVAVTSERGKANVVVRLVAAHDFAHTLRVRYGAEQAKKIEQSLQPQCLSGIGKDKNFRIRRAEVIIPVDDGDFQFYDCAYEEMLQSLGLINDDSSVPWTMFNDDVQMGFFDVYDQHLVNVLYDPRVRPGMTRDEVARLLPDVLPTVRAWVANANLLGRGERHDDASMSRP